MFVWGTHQLEAEMSISKMSHLQDDVTVAWGEMTTSLIKNTKVSVPSDIASPLTKTNIT